MITTILLLADSTVLISIESVVGTLIALLMGLIGFWIKMIHRKLDALADQLLVGAVEREAIKVKMDLLQQEAAANKESVRLLHQRMDNFLMAMNPEAARSTFKHPV